MVKWLPTMRETWVQSLGREDLLEKEIATCSVFLPRKSHGWRSLVSHSPWGHKESDMTEQLHFHFSLLCKNRAFLVAQIVKNLPVMQETWVWSLGRADPLEKGMAPHCSILAWRIPWTEEPGGLQSIASQRVRYNWATSTFTKVTWKLLYPQYSPHFFLNSLCHHTPSSYRKAAPEARPSWGSFVVSQWMKNPNGRCKHCLKLSPTAPFSPAPVHTSWG